MTTPFRETLHAAILDERRFVQLTCKGTISAALPYRQVTVRPVLLKGQRHWQFAHLTARQDLTHNYNAETVGAALAALLALPFSSFHLRLTDAETTYQVSKKGKVLEHHASAVPRQARLQHDSAKQYPLPPDHDHPLLREIGLLNQQGRVKAEMQAKFAQLNEFIKLFIHTGVLETPRAQPLHILDCGCGSAYLSFGLYHYLNHLRGYPATIEGVDVNQSVIAKCQRQAAALDLAAVCFAAAPIAGYQPSTPPDVVVALHACDTATDDALALGIRCQAEVILAAPCCHHHLQRQLSQQVEPFQPLLRHGILKKRMGDLLTDTLRALLLRLHGYKTDVVEFVAAEHTDRNLLLRAVRQPEISTTQAAAEYAALKAFWQVTPYLETLLNG